IDFIRFSVSSELQLRKFVLHLPTDYQQNDYEFCFNLQLCKLKMNQTHQMSSSFPSSEDVTVKRKRGRPRKDRSQDTVKSTLVLPKMDQNQNHGEGAPVPPGFEGVNGNQPPPSVDTTTKSNKEESAVGQVVTGVIEAVFDAGYLLAVRIGDSNTSLRGIVFKPGHYVPVSAENDVAPNLQMIQRNEVPFPLGKQGRKRRGKERSNHHASYPSNGSPTPNQLARVRANQMSIVAAQPPHPVGERGTVVPVVLQPMNLSNGATPAVEAPPIASQPAHLAASKIKQPPLIQEAASKGSQTDSGSASQPFDELVSAAKRMQGSPDPSETRNDSGQSSKVLPNTSGFATEQVQDMSKPLVVKPLQAIRSDPPDQPASIPNSFPERRTGKMTELLLAVQENLMERQTTESHHQDFKNPGK
ncbi:putative high mobility group B protein 11, partial [Bienertia sinuspersici]